MPETYENLLGLINSCVYHAHQTREICKVLPYLMDLKAPGDLWNPPSKQYLINVGDFLNKGPANISNYCKAQE